MVRAAARRGAAAPQGQTVFRWVGWDLDQETPLAPPLLD
jgi:hypothetical protein